MSNVKVQMSNEAQSPNVHKFDLGERTAKFGEEITEWQNP
jgi:hypothetical protein